STSPALRRMSSPESAMVSVTRTLSRSAKRNLLENVEHGIEIFDGDVTHVPDAKRRLLPLAVAAAEGVAALLHLGADRVRRLHRLQRRHRAGRVRRVARMLRKFRGALQGDVAHLPMPLIACVEPLAVDDATELRGERVEVRDRR